MCVRPNGTGAASVPSLRREALGWTRPSGPGTLGAVLTATSELTDAVCRHPDSPARALPVAFTRMSFCKPLAAQIYKTHGRAPGKRGAFTSTG